MAEKDGFSAGLLGVHKFRNLTLQQVSWELMSSGRYRPWHVRNSKTNFDQELGGILHRNGAVLLPLFSYKNNTFPSRSREKNRAISPLEPEPYPFSIMLHI